MATIGPPARPWSSSPSGDSIRFRPGGLVMDAAVSCDDVHRTMVARALGRLAHSARRDASHAGGVPRGPGLRDGRLRRQHPYCASDSGLGRGFTHYQDFIFPELTALKTAVLVSRALVGFQAIVYFMEDWLESAGLRPVRAAPLAVAGHRSQGCGGGQSRVPRLALPSGAAGAAVLRLLELFRCPLSLSTPDRAVPSFRGRTDRRHQRILIQHWWELDKTPALAPGCGLRRRCL